MFALWPKRRQLYAEAGVPFLLVVDPEDDPVSATCFEMEGGEYWESAHSAGGRLTLARPFPVTVDFTGSGR